MSIASNASSEQELLQLRNEGKITEAEYQELLAIMKKPPARTFRSRLNFGYSCIYRPLSPLHNIAWSRCE